MKRVLPFLFVLFLFGSAFGISEESLKGLVEFIRDTFPPVEGYVVGVSGNLAVIDLGSKNLVYKGMVLSISRKGLPFRNPITGQIIAYAEREIGLLQIIRVYPNAAIGRIYSSERVLPGDIVRITRARVSLYIFPFSDKTGEGFNLLAFSDAIRRLLDETGRFRVVGEERVIQEVSAYGGDTTELGLLKALYKIYRRKKEPVFALVGWIDKSGDSYFFRGSIICLNIAKRVKTFSVYIGKAGWRPLAERGIFFVSSFVDGRGEAVAAGDLDGDGRKEVVFAVSNRVLVYSYDPVSKKFEARPGFRFSPTFKVFSMDMADLDRDGKDELILTGSDFKDFIVQSFIYRWDGKKWRSKRIDTKFLRALRTERGVYLVSEYISSENPFVEPPKLVEYYRDSLKETAPIEALKGDLIIGVDFFFDSEGVPYFVVNEDGRVVVKNKEGEVVTDIPGFFGNTGVAFFYREPAVKVFYEGEGFLQISKQDYMRFKELTLTVPGRNVLIRLNGKVLLFVFKNNPYVWGAFFDPFKSSMVKMYRWMDGFFEETGWSRVLSEGIADMYADDLDGDGKAELILLAIKGFKSRKEGLKFNTRLVIYRISGRF